MNYHLSNKIFKCNINITIKDCLEKLEQSSKKILCFEKNNKFFGIINDGDIRRSYLGGFTPKSKVYELINKKPVTASYKYNKARIRDLFVKHKVVSIPLLKGKKVVDIITFDEIFENNKNQFDAVIISGGYGKRLYPLTKNKPKALIKINKKPIIHHIIDRIKKNNVKNINIITHHYHSKIKKNLKQFYKNQINFFKETKPLGTFGGLNLLNYKSLSDNFLIMNCDILSGINFIKLFDYHIQSKSDLTVVSFKKEIPLRYGEIEFEKHDYDILKLNEKPLIEININAGIYIMNKNCLKFLKKNKKIDMPDFLKILKEKKKTIKIFPLYEYWYDIGTLKDLENCKKFLSK